MMTSAHKNSAGLGFTRRGLAAVLSFVLGTALGLWQSLGAEQVSILVLEQEDQGRPAYLDFMSGFRQTLKTNLLETQAVVYAESVGLVRFRSDPDYPAALERWLKDKYRNRTVDIIIPSGPPALPFADRVRQALCPGAPIVVPSVSLSETKQLVGYTNLTAVTVGEVLEPTLALALRLCPEATNLALISSRRGYDEVYREALRNMETFAGNRLNLILVTDLSLEEAKRRMAALPPHTIAHFAGLWVSAKGDSYFPRDALAELSPLSSAPIFGGSETFIGHGSVGGVCLSFQELGRTTAQQVAAVLRAGTASGVPYLPNPPNKTILDWQQVQRYGIDPRRAPPGTEFRFRPPGLWEAHRFAVVLGISAILLQSGLIAALLWQRQRRQRLEQELLAQRNQLAHTGRVSMMGQLAASLAHELAQPLGAILRNTDAAELFLNKPAPDLEELRAIVVDIRQDDQRANQVIDRMRSLLKRRTLKITAVDVNALVRDVVLLAGPDAAARQAQLVAELEPELPAVPGDLVHLQQVLLNLILNGLDAMQNSARKRLLVRARKADRGGVEFLVSDTGEGIPEASLKSVFEPFYTTKSHGMGMGLTLSKTIVEAHGGTLSARNNPEGGATFSLTLPVWTGSKTARR